MQISQEQARLAAELIRSAPRQGSHENSTISAELMTRILEEIEHCPETRADRVAAAREHLRHGRPDASDVARMMISRIISDSLR